MDGGLESRCVGDVCGAVVPCDALDVSCSMWFSVPSVWMGGGLESRCVGDVCGAVVPCDAHHQEH